MRGTFKLDGFDTKKLNDFVTELKQSGFDFEVTWLKGRKKVEAESNTANALALKHNGKEFFRQFMKQGFANPQLLDEDQRISFISLLKKFGIYSKPDFNLSLMLVFVFIVLQLALVGPGAMARSETLFFIILGLNISLVLGLILLAKAVSNVASNGIFIPAIIFLAPGFLFLSPASLPNIVLIKNLFHKQLYVQVNANLE